MLNLKKLKTMRQQKVLTQAQLAEKIGIVASHYSNIERGTRSASIEILDTIVQALDVSLDELWSDDDAAMPTLPSAPTEKGIVVENGEGLNRTRYILPPTKATYDLIHQHMTQWESMHDPRMHELIRMWRIVNENTKEKILTLLQEAGKSSE